VQGRGDAPAATPRTAPSPSSAKKLTPIQPPLLDVSLERRGLPDKVWLKGEDYFREWNFDPVLGEQVVRVDPGAHAVHLLGGRVIPYDRLLIASGARPRLLALRERSFSGVYTLRTLADWQRLAAGLPKAGRVVVVGAGAVGLKTADALARRGLTVTLVARGAEPLSRVLDALSTGMPSGPARSVPAKNSTLGATPMEKSTAWQGSSRPSVRVRARTRPASPQMANLNPGNLWG